MQSKFIVVSISVCHLPAGNLRQKRLTLVQSWGGFAWSGVMLSAANSIYDAVTPQKRVHCIACFNVINDVALFLGSSLGGFMARGCRRFTATVCSACFKSRP